MGTRETGDKLIIANCSGFYGDRLSAAKEMVQGGPIDVLTGDYLAELTMALLIKSKMKNPDAGYVPTFLMQMEEIMGECLDKKIRIVSNAGGLNPKGMADALKSLGDKCGLHPKIAHIEGDDLLPRIKTLQDQGEPFLHMDKEISLADDNATPITANAYLGCWGIAEALKQGADIVVCGRVADAALIAGPAAWYFDWNKDDWNRLSGAYAAGHIIECGAQATGGNYSFIHEVPSYKNVGFPIAEMAQDGSSVITKHPGTGGLVSVGTVTAQLLYEINQPSYLTPDVTAHFNTLYLKQDGTDRVKVSGAKGSPPPNTSKVCINTLGGYKNSMTIMLTGLDIEKKADIITDVFVGSIGGRDRFQTMDIQLQRSDKENPNSNVQAFAYLHISVMDRDEKKVGKFFPAKIVEMALANIPGFNVTAPPSKGSPVIVHWPALVSSKHLSQHVHVDGNVINISATHQAENETPMDDVSTDRNLIEASSVETISPEILPMPKGDTVKFPFGRAFATRAGDKGGNANLGVWGKTVESYAFLKDFLTVEKLKSLLPDCAEFRIDRYELPNLLALNFYIHGILGDGVAASLRSDPQAKTLGEYLRAKIIEMPESIVVQK